VALVFAKKIVLVLVVVIVLGVVALGNAVAKCLPAPPGGTRPIVAWHEYAFSVGHPCGPKGMPRRGYRTQPRVSTLGIPIDEWLALKGREDTG